eukprot:g645.t1
MIDKFVIFSKSGLILWQQVQGKLASDPVDELIGTVLMEDRITDKSFTRGDSKLQWTVDNQLDLVFVVVYQKILTLVYIEDLLEQVKSEFGSRYGKKLPLSRGVEFKKPFDRIMAEVEFKSIRSTKKPTRQKTFSETSKAKKLAFRADAADKASAAEDEEKKAEAAADADDADAEFAQMMAARAKMKAKSGGGMRGFQAKKNPKKEKKEGKPGKKMTTWVGGGKVDAASMAALDRSAVDSDDSGAAAQKKLDAMRKEYIDEDAEEDEEVEWDDEVDDEAAGGSDEAAASGWFGSSRIGGFLKQLTGNKVLEDSDLEPVLAQVRTTLLEKNVASEVADRLVAELKETLRGEKLDTFGRVSAIVKAQLEESMTRILTPKRSTDVLREVKAVRAKGRPYVIVFIGVNGVGKSTSLSKVCYYLKQNGCNPLIAACDTFRSGAVEQLKTHCDCLGVELFQRGYTKDPAMVAKEAVEQAAEQGNDVVLIDTAGRMQNNKPLMIALTKLISTNNPDLVLFVGEALVGNDGIDQLEMFNQALADYSSQDDPHTVDGICLTKFDTIDDKVGAALSMVYKTGQPVIFVGTGQKYNNLKKLNVRFVIKCLAG